MKKRNTKLLSIIMATMVAVSTSPVSSFAQENDPIIPSDIINAMMERQNSKFETLPGANPLNVDDDKWEENEVDVIGDPEEVVRVIVELENKPATLMLPDGEQPSEEMIERVKLAQQPIQTKVKTEVDGEIRHTYGNLINGFSAEVKRKDIDKIKDMDGVLDVREANIYYRTMNTSKEVTEVLDVVDDYGYSGEGLVVSIIDSGIDYTHKDMKLTDTSKAKLDAEDADKGIGKFYSEKVPYGYNYADDNDQIVDNTGSMHGMHVAGIVGANASDDEVNSKQGIQGVAPEAQLLAMRVFSDNANNPGAYSDDIIAAIEGSVEMEADVINMSLGSNSGYRDELSPEQIAIKNATDDGVICVVAAGNAATSTDPLLLAGISDISTVGSPGTAKDALQVASSDNSYMMLPALTANVEGNDVLMAYTECDINPVDIFTSDEALEIVDCGLGTFMDFWGKDLTGKIALVSRGEISFIDKQVYAQMAKAEAVIIYNNTDGYINMASDPKVKIPAVSISKKDGEMLKENLESSKVSFKGNTVEIAISNGLEMSSFTSWGPTPTLDFAPQITAPGGSIYSTLNNDKYGNMSGTSMATPHTAGATALIIQGLKENGINLEGRELVEFVKRTIINTANTLTETNALGEENVPYSPRRQGAGMVQAKAAIDNRVLVTGKDGEAVVALKEIGDKTEFTLTLTNYSNVEHSYDVENFGGVLTAFDPAMDGQIGYQVMAFDTVLEEASLDFSKTNVVVPANGQTTVKVTLNIPAGSVDNNFVEGFIKFNSVDEATPSLVVPYMGFYGDWNSQKIIDGTIWDEESVTISPSFGATLIYGEYNYLGLEKIVDKQPIINPEKMAISPNEDMVGDTFIPVLYLLRNAKEIMVDVLDENHNVIGKAVTGETGFRKKIFGNAGGNSAGIYESIEWNGKVYNNKTGKLEVVPDGQYYLNYRAKLDGDNREFKDYIMPVKVDTEKVSSTIVSDKSVDSKDYVLEMEFGGDVEKDSVAQIIVRVNGRDIGYEGAEGPYEIPGATVTGDRLSVDISEYLYEDDVNYIQIATLDYAFNMNYEAFTIEVGNCTATAQIVGFAEGEFIPADEYTVYGEYSGPVGKILVNGEDAEFNYDGMFTKKVKLTEGRNFISFYAEDKKGNVIANHSHTIYSDMTAPALNLTSPYINENDVVVTSDDKIVLKGNVQDNLAGYKFTVNGELKLDIGLAGGEGKDTYREFEYEIPVESGDIISLNVVDLAGNETVKQFTVEVVEEVIPEVKIEGVENGGLYNKDVTPVITVSPEDTEHQVTLNGEAYDGSVISNEGVYELVVKVTGSNGTEVRNTVNFEIDKTAPVVTITSVQDGGVYNTNILPDIKGEAGTTTVVTLNDKEYDGSVLVEEGVYSLKVVSTDKAGNVSEVVVNFEIDKTVPTVFVEGVVDGMKYDKEFTPVITVEEGVETVITLNGKPYDGSTIKDDGEYVLIVTSTDKAGNKTEVVYNFTIKKSGGPIVDPTPKPEPNPNPKPNPDGDKETDGNNKPGNGGSNGSGGKGDKLPQTGAAVGTGSILALALSLIGAGAYSIKKKKK